METAVRELPGDAIAALEKGSNIDAIKVVRQAQGIGLKDAKDVVEDFLRGHPELEGRLAAASLAAAQGSLRWLLLVAAIGMGAFLWLGRG